MDIKPVNVNNVEIKEFPIKSNEKGSLCVCQSGIDVPFQFQRFFYIFGTPENSIRGQHAHKESWQIHVCQGGHATIYLDDGKNKQTIEINKPNQAIIIGPMVWHSFSLSEGAIFFVISSNYYSEDDYIRDYKEFEKLTSGEIEKE